MTLYQKGTSSQIVLYAAGREAAEVVAEAEATVLAVTVVSEEMELNFYPMLKLHLSTYSLPLLAVARVAAGKELKLEMMLQMKPALPFLFQQ